MNKKIIVGLDIGTTKIACFIGERVGEDKVHILGFGKTESRGVQHGVVRNIKNASESILRAVKQAEEQAGIEVKEVYVGIAGQHIRSIHNEGSIMIPASHREINEEDVDRLIEQQNNIMLQPGEEIIHIFPQTYYVDNEELSNEISPIGVGGKCLKATFHIITGNTDNLNSIRYSVEDAGLKIKGVVLEPIASAYAVLDDQDREAGVALVDIGGGTTDVAVLSEGILRHTSVLPLAGQIITEDIRKGCNILVKQAEDMKMKFGSCLPSNVNQDDIISIPGIRNGPAREISKKTLAGIIHARVQIILEQVEYELQLSGYEKMLIAGVVLTGGGAQLQHIRDFCELITRIDSRIGIPNEHLEMPQNPDSAEMALYNELGHPMYATGIGLVLYGLEQEMAEEYTQEESVTKGQPAAEEQPVAEEQLVTEEPSKAKPKLNTQDIFSSWSEQQQTARVQHNEPQLEPTPQPREKNVDSLEIPYHDPKPNPRKRNFSDFVKNYLDGLFLAPMDDDE